MARILAADEQEDVAQLECLSRQTAEQTQLGVPLNKERCGSRMGAMSGRTLETFTRTCSACAARNRSLACKA